MTQKNIPVEDLTFKRAEKEFIITNFLRCMFLQKGSAGCNNQEPAVQSLSLSTGLAG